MVLVGLINHKYTLRLKIKNKKNVIYNIIITFKFLLGIIQQVSTEFTFLLTQMFNITAQRLWINIHMNEI